MRDAATTPRLSQQELIRLGSVALVPLGRMRWREEREASGREYECSTDCDYCWRSFCYLRGLEAKRDA